MDKQNISDWRRTAVKLHIDQMMRTRNFRVRNEVVEKEQSPRVKWERKPTGECFQWKAHGQCSRGDSCSFSHVQGDLYGGQRRKGRSSNEGCKNRQKHQATERKALQTKRSEIPCRYKKIKTLHVNVGALLCVKTTSLKTRCKFGGTCFFRHVEADEKPSKKSKKGGAKWCSCIIERVHTTGLCISRFWSEKVEKWGSRHAGKFL